MKFNVFQFQFNLQITKLPAERYRVTTEIVSHPQGPRSQWFVSLKEATLFALDLTVDDHRFLDGVEDFEAITVITDSWNPKRKPLLTVRYSTQEEIVQKRISVEVLK